LSYV